MKSMRVTVCFGQTRVIVPCKGGATVSELVKEACARYKRAIGKTPKYWVKIRQLENAVDGGILDVDDYVYDVAEDRDQLIAVFEEEDDQPYHHNGWDRQSGSSSDGRRSPLFYQNHPAVTTRYSNDKNYNIGNRVRSPGRTGNAAVIKHGQQQPDLEVDVGPAVLNSSTHITVRRGSDLMLNKLEDSEECSNQMNQNTANDHQLHYGRRESGSGQEEDTNNLHSSERNNHHHHQRIMITTANSSPDRDTTTSTDTNNSIDGGRYSGRVKSVRDSKNYGNFSRGGTRQSIMGMLTDDGEGKLENKGTRQPPDGRKRNSSDFEDLNGLNKSRHSVERYVPPSPTDESKFPWFYNDSQEMFVDIDDRPLGLQVVSFKDNKTFCGLLVKSIDEGGRSDREGLLQQGDVIIEINHYVLAQYMLPVAQEIFKNAMKFPELQLRVYPVEERERVLQEKGEKIQNALNEDRYAPSIPEISLVEATPPKSSIISSAKSLPDLNTSQSSKSILSKGSDASSVAKQPLVARMSYDTLSNNTRKIGNMFEIDLRKGVQGLGFSITTRDTPVGDPGPIYIKNILPKGAAIQDGRLQSGDRLLQVDDIEMTGHTQESAVNILRCIEVGSVVKLIVSRHVSTLPRKMKEDPVADKVLSDDSHREYFMFEIALNDTGSAGLGISLKGNQSKKTGRDLGIFIKSVFHGGAAYQDGRLRANDQLVSVNGQSLIGMSNHEAIDTLRSSMSTVGNVRGMIQMVIARRKLSSGGPMSPNFSSEASSDLSDSLLNEHHSRSSFEVTGQSRDDYHGDDSLRYQEDVPQQIDPTPIDNYQDRSFQDGHSYLHGADDWPPSPEALDPDLDPFSRESIFRQSISEKRRGPAAREAQDMDTFKAIKTKQINSGANLEKKAVTPDVRTSSTPVTSSSTVKWIKPSSTTSTPTSSTPVHSRSQLTRSPAMNRRNLNNSSNLPARIEKTHDQPPVAVGPVLGIAKSSSLESLQTAVENYVDSKHDGDVPYPRAQPRVLRGRVMNESFRAALGQSYDMENFGMKPMAPHNVREEGSSGPHPPSSDDSSRGRVRTHEKKRAGKSYKIFGLFRVGKNKRSMSSDRNLDRSSTNSFSSTSSSPHLPESEVHKRLLEAKREDDFKKHQAENERIQAKARAMREQQEEKKKQNEKYRSCEDLLDCNQDERIRAPSVPVTAMQRINPEPRTSYADTPSGRRSVDPSAMRGTVHPQTFDWYTKKRPTSPIDYSGPRHKGGGKKSAVNNAKSVADYSSLPRSFKSRNKASKITKGNRALSPIRQERFQYMPQTEL